MTPDADADNDIAGAATGCTPCRLLAMENGDLWRLLAEVLHRTAGERAADPEYPESEVLTGTRSP
jgi:hypothetical protein